MNTLTADLKQVTFALSDALDLVGIDDTHHGKRVAFMAVKCAEVLGWSDARTDDLFFAGMLHDCGVSSTDMHLGLVSSMERKDEESHCVTGARMLESFAPLARLAPIVRWHHTHWKDLQNRDDLPKEVAEAANLIFLVDRVDAVMAMQGNADPLLARKTVLEKIEGLSGKFFNPPFVAALKTAARNEAFWLMQGSDTIVPQLSLMLAAEAPAVLSMPQLKALAGMFARIVDVKSPFTADHSTAVARLAVRMGRAAGLDGGHLDQVEVAALLHDLGKLRVPDAVLDKPAPLDEAERAQILRHSFDTYNILSRIDGFQQIAQWAGLHHESVDGDGYPFHLEGEGLPLEARIIAVADVYQALAQDRPYRAGLPPEDIGRILTDMRDGGHLDVETVDMVLADMDGYFAISR